MWCEALLVNKIKYISLRLGKCVQLKSVIFGQFCVHSGHYNDQMNILQQTVIQITFECSEKFSDPPPDAHRLETLDVRGVLRKIRKNRKFSNFCKINFFMKSEKKLIKLQDKNGYLK